jgi:hypothetical protein
MDISHTNGQPYTIINGQRVNARSEPEPVKVEPNGESDSKPIEKQHMERPTFPVK